MDIFKPSIDPASRGVSDAKSGADPNPNNVVLDVRDEDERQSDNREYNDAYQSAKLNEIAKNSKTKDD
ncbi:MAG TPA: hypothetical protein VFE35_03100 [Candidatus Cybelea sp.]|jgi:hypothetical protein|nr:hypothetical protein [Candidatus Cybelea sp.]